MENPNARRGRATCGVRKEQIWETGWPGTEKTMRCVPYK